MSEIFSKLGQKIKKKDSDNDNLNEKDIEQTHNFSIMTCPDVIQ